MWRSHWAKCFSASVCPNRLAASAQMLFDPPDRSVLLWHVSPALSVCGYLLRRGAQLMAYDPKLSSLDERELERYPLVALDDPYLATTAAEAVVVLTEWAEYGDLDRAIAPDSRAR